MKIQEGKMKNVLVIDLLEESGHVQTNKKFLSILQSEFDVSFITSSSYSKVIGFKKTIELKDAYFRKKGGILNRLSQIYLLFKINEFINDTKYDSVIFLSYETISTFLYSKLSKNRRVFLFNHNNIDQLLSSKIKAYCFRSLGDEFVHLSYEKYISDFIEYEFNKESKVVFHPLAFKNHGPKDETTIRVFAPSASGVSKATDLVSILEKIEGVTCNIKGDPKLSSSSCRVQSRFDDYEHLMQTSNFVIILAEYNYRVSGVAYEGLSCGCKLILDKSRFSEFLASKYPSDVVIISSIDELANILTDENYSPSTVHTELQDSQSDKAILKQLQSIFSAG